MKKRYKISLLVLISITCFCLLFFFYANSLQGVNSKTVDYYHALKTELTKQGYKPSLIVISGKRAKWHNQLLTYFGAASKSQHLKGNAIDILVLDVINDGAKNIADVIIVKKILENLIKSNGGLGTYQEEEWFWNRQMIHLDCRGYKARWNR